MGQGRIRRAHLAPGIDMLAVRGIYDGNVAIPDQPVSVTGRQEVIITFLEPVHTQTAEGQAEILKRLGERKKILDSLAGLIPPDVDEDAIKNERLTRQ